MSDLVPADANHIVRAFVRALRQQRPAAALDVAIDSVAALVADRVLGILDVNGLMIMQAASGFPGDGGEA